MKNADELQRVAWRTGWLDAACWLAEPEVSLLIECNGTRTVVTALDSCKVAHGLLYWGEGEVEFRIADTLVVGFRVGEDEPWEAVPDPCTTQRDARWVKASPAHPLRASEG